MTRPASPHFALSRLTGGALFSDAAGRVLLVRPTYKTGWDIPGGYAEPGDLPTPPAFVKYAKSLASHHRSSVNRW